MNYKEKANNSKSTHTSTTAKIKIRKCDRNFELAIGSIKILKRIMFFLKIREMEALFLRVRLKTISRIMKLMILLTILMVSNLTINISNSNINKN